MTERYIVTSALPYINGVKHLGNLIGSLLPADVYARYLRLKGKDVVTICGTDDHGTPAELSALEENLPVDKYVKKYYKIQKDIYEKFNLSFDYFGQTHTKENEEETHNIFVKLYENGFLNIKKDKQLYSKEDDRYLPDRYVIGTCPHCEYDRARGDQCENCSTLLNPTELINPKSSVSGSTDLEIRETQHFYLDLPKIQPKVEEWVNSQDQWPITTKSIAKKWLKEGLRERAITRNLKWGFDIPVDQEKHKDLRIYVWFDAPIGYIGITKQWAKNIGKPDLWKDYWKNNDTTLIQFMGIDNVPFHTVTFPCSIIGANDGYVLAKHVKGFQWLTYEGGKFSTSQNRGVFTDKALDLYPPDYWRYYLLLIAPERQDTDFQWKGLQNAVNNDLNNLLGNLLNRFVTFVDKHFEGKVPKYKIGEKEIVLQQNLNDVMEEYDKTFKLIEFQKPLKSLRKFWSDCNKYFQENEPWKKVKEDKEATASTIAIIGHALRSIAILSAPFIPDTAENIFEALGFEREDVHNILWENVVDWDILVESRIPSLKKNIFSKISNKEVEKLKIEYGSNDVKKDKKMGKKREKKLKKDEKKKDEQYISYDEFTKVKLITAKILKVDDHPKADKLLIITLDDGKRKDRTICAGIKEFYNKEELINKTVLIVDNLKPRKLRGIVSDGMILAVDIDEQNISLLSTDKTTKTGLQVH